MKNILIAAGALLLAAPAWSESHVEVQGDAAAGEEQFNRQCVACHVVQNEEGETLAGRNARTGPNLYGVAMRQLGSVEDFRYGDSIVELGEQGTVWTEENFVGYVQDPTGWLRETLDNPRARGKMAYKVRAEEDAFNLYAYLASVSPETEATN
ncbi:c-type cytochrome [Jannaschia sp. S6380]|uniref:c-type cytochrome n=1 Tax=Jannaschia sp. S6380 TaxID=2926408 RepID=UPI001FF44029|nr:c-type cytochrome [Jannaschia sp. S6380]MCK0167649.1 c-type cytochrome [Jannaschia sp. S6380]